MQDSSKYLIHADVSADGIVERTDVVGAVFGQTEGLLGDDLDLRHLQDASKIGRVDVEIESRNGQSYGELTIATNLDKVETATLAAALETITRIGPCRATVEVRSLEDLRAAKRRRIVERAQELLVEAFDDSMMTSEELVEEVRRRIRVEDITEYEGLPAGPRVGASDALVVVEGRADVLAVLEAGVKNAIAVEGTDVPEAVADLTQERTTTAFLDGDRGGDLILKELAQVGDVDYVAFAPADRSVEDLSRTEILAALRGKVEYQLVADTDTPHEVVGTPVPETVPDEADTPASEPAENKHPEAELQQRSDPAEPPASVGEDGTADGATPDRSGGDSKPHAETTVSAGESTDGGVDSSHDAADGSSTAGSATTVTDEDSATAADGDAATTADGDATTTAGTDGAGNAPSSEPSGAEGGGAVTSAEGSGSDQADASDEESGPPETLHGHVDDVADSGEVRLLDGAMNTVGIDDADAAFDAIAEADTPPSVVVLDGTADQRLLDVSAQRGVERIIATTLGEFTKRPTAVRLTPLSAFLSDSV